MAAPMKLITESQDYVLVETVLGENPATRNYYITGVFLQANIQNRNGRVYPIDILSQEVDRYNRAYVSQNRALGELGHPEGPTINMERVSHLITDLHQDGNNFIGKAKILDTPYGKIVKSLIDEGVKLGVSSRGMGSLRENSRGVQEVGDDFVLCTGADIVADPSAPSAFVQGIREGKEWIFENGLLKEKDTVRVKQAMNKLSVKEAEAFMVREFSNFLSKL
jgi:hypothetical protein